MAEGERQGHAATLVFAFAFVVLGLPDFAHGVAWPAMRSQLHRPLADLGTFLVVQAAGYLAVALAAGRLAWVGPWAARRRKRRLVRCAGSCCRVPPSSCTSRWRSRSASGRSPS